MTTTDPTPLAEQIAREHSRVTAAGACLCGAEGIGFEVGYAEHIATVTEQAVVERARDAVARMNITGPMRAIFTDPVHREALDALEVLVAQETETALHAIANGATDA